MSVPAATSFSIRATTAFCGVDLGLVQIADGLQLRLLILDVGHCLLPVGIGVQQVGSRELPGVLGQFLARPQAGHGRPGHRQDGRSEPRIADCGNLKLAVERRARANADRASGRQPE